MCRIIGAALLLALLSHTAVTEAHAQSLSFSKAFAPNTIGPGSVSTLTFTITNNSAAPAIDLAFTDNLPSGVTVATPANVLSECGVGVSAPDGGGTISLTGGSVAGSSTCTISVEVTSSAAGTHTNTTGTLTSSIGSGGTASDDLTVAVDRPGFTKSFAPSTVVFGGKSTLTFTIDNTANDATASNLTFTDTLPSGMTVASPANASSDCAAGIFTGGVITATPGSNVISLSSGGGFQAAAVGAGSSCTVTVDVVGGAVGQLDNVTGDLTSIETSPIRSSGKAGAALTVTTDTIVLNKSFTDDPVAPGGAVTLDFIIFNLSRADQATGIAFTDDLDAALSGLAMTSVLSNDCNGSVSGTGTISFSGGTLAPEATCTVSVSLAVPTGAASGSYTNTTSAISANVGGASTTGAAASDEIFVEPSPFLTKTFLNNPAGAGDTTTVRFTITNTSPSAGATAIAYSDSLLDIVTTAFSEPADGSTCGSGSTFTFTPQVQSGTFNNPARFTLTGGSLDPGASCSIHLGVNIATGTPPGAYGDPTGAISATVGGSTFVGRAAVDSLFIAGAVIMTKAFTDDPVEPGATVTLDFTLIHSANATDDATDIAFTDDLDATLSGLTMASVLSNDCGGTVSGTDTITFSGGSLSPGETCTISASLDVPSTAPVGNHTNTTSAVTATVGGVTTVGAPAQDDLLIAGLRLTKTFNPNPVLITDGTVDYTFTLDNISPTENATGIAVREEDLEDALSGLRIVPPVDAGTCDGTLASLSGNRILDYSGGSLTAGASCSFTVTLDLPDIAPEDLPQTIASPTTTFAATMGGSPIGFENVIAGLTIVEAASFIAVTKEFLGDPVAPDDTLALAFTVTFAGPSTAAASGINFTDTLGTVLAGLASITPTQSGFCGPNSSLTFDSNDGVLTFSDGLLDLAQADSVCTFSVDLVVPAGTADGVYVNVTDSVRALVGAESIVGPPAVDELVVVPGATGGGGGGREEDITVATNRDAFLRPGNQDRNEGANPLLDLGESRRLVVGFDLGTINVAAVDSAGLILTINDDDPPGNWGSEGRTVDAHGLLEAFVEGNGKALGLPNPEQTRGTGSGVTWNCAVDTEIEDQNADCDPQWNGGAFEATATDQVTITNGLSGEVVWDVTADVQAGLNSWLIQKTSGNGNARFYALDHPDVASNGALAARLFIVLDDTDSDSDGVPDVTDNCPVDANPDQEDLDGDGIGDVCDADLDGDGVDNTADNCPVNFNPGQEDGDGDGTGDACDAEEVITADKDAFLRDGSANHNEGANPLLLLGNSRRLVAGFDLSGVNTASVTTARLILTINDDDPPGNWGSEGRTVDAHRLLESFVEGNGKDQGLPGSESTRGTGSGVTWNCAVDTEIEDQNADCDPQWNGGAFEATATDQVTITDGLSGEVVWDVTADVTGGFDSWLFKKTSGNGNADFYAKEHPDVAGTATLAPRLELDFDASGQPDEAVAVEEDAAVPATYVLEGNYPNPFNPETTLRFGLPQAADVTLTVYDVLGRQVRVLVDGRYNAGTHAVVFEARDLPSGLYLYRLETPAGSFVQTMLLLK